MSAGGTAPRYFVVLNAARGKVVASRVAIAADLGSRSKGLLGRTSLAPEEGLWIVPCPMIHTFFMKFPIDALFLDDARRVVRVIEGLKPWRVSPWVWSARSVLELKGGVLRGSVRVGDRLEMTPA